VSLGVSWLEWLQAQQVALHPSSAVAVTSVGVGQPGKYIRDDINRKKKSA